MCSIFKAPIAIVSLVEKERQWFKSIVGLSVSETSRASSFCAWTLLPVNPEVLVVEDATEDPRCARSAGTTARTDSIRLGKGGQPGGAGHSWAVDVRRWTITEVSHHYMLLCSACPLPQCGYAHHIRHRKNC